MNIKIESHPSETNPESKESTIILHEPKQYTRIVGDYETQPEVDAFVAGVHARGEFELTMAKDRFTETVEKLNTNAPKVGAIILLTEAEYRQYQTAAYTNGNSNLEEWIQSIVHQAVNDLVDPE